MASKLPEAAGEAGTHSLPAPPAPGSCASFSRVVRWSLSDVLSPSVGGASLWQSQDIHAGVVTRSALGPRFRPGEAPWCEHLYASEQG